MSAENIFTNFKMVREAPESERIMKEFVIEVSTWTEIEAKTEQEAVEKIISAMNKDFNEHDGGVYFEDISIDEIQEG